MYPGPGILLHSFIISGVPIYGTLRLPFQNIRRRAEWPGRSMYLTKPSLTAFPPRSLKDLHCGVTDCQARRRTRAPHPSSPARLASMDF
ncbi:hypothetical protein ColTof4_08666 [Colletotrichum tofieldiae]|nr:hypothetical protein ColTof3_04133 [Colletotrichum tofieldiae]GKT76243.1 hypothetical protein ColTof4_08666 [Colletotrichum tofieldiae]